MEAVRGEFDRAAPDDPIDVAFGRIEAGTCGAVCTRAIGVVDGRGAIVVEHVIRMSRAVAPHWPNATHDATCTAAMPGTAMRVVNAVPFVVAAQPELLGSLDLPLTVPRTAPID